MIELEECLSGITDSRRQTGHFLHKLTDVLIIGLTTVLTGWNEYSVMEDFGKAKQDFFKQFLSLPNGIPDEKTFARVFSLINPQELLECLNQWLGAMQISAGEPGGREINIDGKTICGSTNKRQGNKGTHIVSAWVNAQELVLGQLATEEKSNEITAIPDLLDQMDITGDTITIDAMGCQTEIAEKIRRKEANYVLAVKENQKDTYWEIKDYFDAVDQSWEKGFLPTDVWKSGVEKDHGRIEKREVRTEEDLSWMSCLERWKDLKTIIHYRCTRTQGDKTSRDDRYYISNLELDAEKAAQLIRGHWSIENRLHWFGEDQCRARTNHAAENLDVLRKIALRLLRKTSVPEKRFGTSRKMLRAGQRHLKNLRYNEVSKMEKDRNSREKRA
jgi:predicted transposase YbfD/YdcC